MNTEFNFIINENKKIIITIPDVKTKYNYFFKPTKRLHRCDEATAYFIEKNHEKLEIKKHTLDDVVLNLYGKLKSIIDDNNLKLPKNCETGTVGYELNNMLMYHNNDFFSQFWTWSSISSKADTLIYQADNKIYIEIVPSYPWLFSEPELDNPEYITFEEFMKNYKPYVVETISRETAKEWLQQCEEILKIIIKP